MEERKRKRTGGGTRRSMEEESRVNLRMGKERERRKK